MQQKKSATPTITQPQQLVLHATLGAAISTSLGGDALSGAISGVASEYIASESLKNGTSPQNAILIGQATGAASALITSAALNRTDEQMAKDTQLGGFVGVNATVNNLTLLVTGTEPTRVIGLGESSSNSADPKLKNSIEQTFGEEITPFTWSGGVSDSARNEAANNLLEVVNNHEFKPGEQLNFVGFSHGGNVIDGFTQLYSGNKKIDNVVLIGTPQVSDYRFDFSDLSFGANAINVYGNQDKIQVLGSILKGEPSAPRTLDGFTNIMVDQKPSFSPVKNHLNLPTQDVWDNKIKPELGR